MQPFQAFDHPAFQKMANIAARATRGLKFLSRKQTRSEIIRAFKEQMKALKEQLNVSSLSVTSSLYPLPLHFRARLSVAKSVSLAMPGRRQILMRTSLSPAIGLRRKPLGSGLNRRRFSAWLRWTPLTMEFDWAKHYTRFAIGWASFTRYMHSY